MTPPLPRTLWGVAHAFGRLTTQPVRALVVGGALVALALAGLTSPPAAAEQIPEGVVCEPAPTPPAKATAKLVAPEAIEVPAGATKVVPATVELGARPTPVDVFFVIDSSKSMAPVFESLKVSIARAAADLEASGIDVHVGLAIFDNLQTRPYDRRVPLGPVTCDTVRQIATVIADGGGFEPHRFALEQAVTGSGREEVEVEPGQGADWRPGTLRLVVHATDAGVRDLPYSPTHTELVGIFAKHHARHVGIHAYGVGEEASAGEVQADLDQLGLDTGTVAPPAGIDCDGNGSVDIAGGDPVTCPFGLTTNGQGVNASVGGLLTQVVRALRATTGVDVAASPPTGVEVDIDPPTRQVDLAAPAPARYDLAVRCAPERAGTTADLGLAARVAGDVVANSVSRVACLAPPTVAAAARPGASPPPPQAPASPAVVPSAATQGAGQASVPAAASSPVPAQSPGFGIAIAPEQELQVARARAGSADDGGTRTRAAGTVMALGAAAVLARRRAVAPQRRR